MPVPPAVRVRGGGLQGAAHAAARAAGRAVDSLLALRALRGGCRGRPCRVSRSCPRGQGMSAAPAGPPGGPLDHAEATGPAVPGTAGSVLPAGPDAPGTGPLLAATDIAVQFAVGSALAARLRHEQRMLRAVDGVDLVLARRGALALVGDSGSGKSTLALALAGLRPVNHGEIRFDGRVLPARRSRADQRRIQMVFQGPYSSLTPRLTVGGMLRELLKGRHEGAAAQTESDNK